MVRISIILFILLILPLQFYSQQIPPEASGKETQASGGRNSSETMPAVPLSFKEATNLALKNSLDIQIAKFDAYISRTSLRKAKSVFDAFLNLEFQYDRDKREPASTILGTETTEHSYSAGIEKKLSAGTDVSLSFSSLKKETDSPFSTLNPYYEVSLGVSLTQPLGKNFFGLADRADITITKIDIENSGYTSLDNIEDALGSAQKAYWTLALKSEALSIKKDMLKEAEKLYQIYLNKYSLGLAERSELLAAEALLRSRESEVEAALLEKETAENNLLFLLNSGDFNENIAAKDSLTCPTAAVDLYQALRDAIKHRRDYKRIKNEIERNRISLVVKKNALWPEIDLSASLLRNNLDASSSKALSSLSRESNDEVILGLTFKIPIENRKAGAELNEAKLKKQQSLLLLKRTERLILRELNNRVNEINTAHKQVALLSSIVDIHQRKLAEEIRRLKSGRSNVDTLIRYEEDLLGAKLALAQMLFNYRASLINLELAKNTLLDKYWKDKL